MGFERAILFVLVSTRFSLFPSSCASFASLQALLIGAGRGTQQPAKAQLELCLMRSVCTRMGYGQHHTRKPFEPPPF